MTCKEKLVLDMPEWTSDTFAAYLGWSCPSYCDYLDDPKYCDNGASLYLCEKCWNREIPEENKEENEMSYEYFVEMENEQSVAAIKDSGDRTEFASGAQRDMHAGKGRFDVMPLEVIHEYLVGIAGKQDDVLTEIALFQRNRITLHLYRALGHFVTVAFDKSDETMLLEVAKHYEAGAIKYEPDNWRHGLPVWCYIDSAVRHYIKWQRGDNDENHDLAFCWNLLCCIWEVDYGEDWRKDQKKNT